eukprot:TRINITY_DN805_c1_g1_i1.p1 TRINITY_DN805_c1_g1~~TRINITY_DN805_c1_g1_i1.p1  ORF type:complete len:720 (-),score=158.67 TRINITY_DN805_c1_g1_i1:218-2326(-)
MDACRIANIQALGMSTTKNIIGLNFSGSSLVLTTSSQIQVFKSLQNDAVSSLGWTTRPNPSDELTHPAIMVDKNTFAAVKAKRNIIFWNKNKKMLKGDGMGSISVDGVAHVLSSPGMPLHLISITEKGKISLFNVDGGVKTLSSLNLQAKGTSAALTVLGASLTSTSHWNFLSVVYTARKECHLKVFLVSSPQVVCVFDQKLETPSDECSILKCATEIVSSVHNNTTVHLFVKPLWSNGILQFGKAKIQIPAGFRKQNPSNHRVNSKLLADQVRKNRLFVKFERHLKGFIDYSKKGDLSNLCSVSPMKDSLVSVLYPCDDKFSLTIWDSVYGVVVGHRMLDLSPSQKSKLVMADNGKDTFVVANGKNGLSVHYKAMAPTLASVAGRMRDTIPFLEDTSCLHPPVTAVARLDVYCNGSSEDALGLSKQEMKCQNDLKNAKNVKEFSSVLKAFLSADSCVVSHSFSQTVVQEVLSRPTENLWNGLQTLLKSHVVSAKANNNLLPALIKAKELDTIKSMLTYVHDIPEKALVRLARFTLSLDPVYGKDHENGFAGLVEEILGLIVSYPRNDVFLQRALQELIPAETMCMLTVLKRLLTHSWFPNKLELGAEPESKKRRMALPPHMLDWTALVLDGSFSVLVAGADTELLQLLEGLNSLVKMEKQFCHSALALCPQLEHTIESIKNGVIPTNNATVAEYCVEVLQI